MIRPSQMTNFGWGEAPPRAAGGGVLADMLLRVVDLGLIGVICIAPFFFGGRNDLGRLVLVALISITAAAWFMRQATLRVARWPRTIAHVVLLLAAALLVVQIVPLPPAWIEALSPRLAELLPLWTPGGGEAAQLGTWQTLSLTPHETTKSLAMLLSYGLLFVVVVGRIETATDVRRFQNYIAVAAVLMAAFGILQYFTSDGRFFWFYPHPYRSAAQSLSGAFVNRNHFAHFLVLGIGPLVAWLMYVAAQQNGTVPGHKAPITIAQRLSVWAIGAALALVVAAALCSWSRGGAIVLLAAGAVLVAIYFRRGLVGSGFLYGLISLVIVVIGLLSLHGYDRLVQRLDDFTEGSLDGIDHDGIRRKVWAANLAAINAFPVAGTGAGSHREICPVYLPESFTKKYTHAENGYLQIVTENGVGGLMLLLAGAAIVGSWIIGCFRHMKQAADVQMFAAAAAGLAASLVHSAVDFVWYIPACMSITIVFAGCVLRLSQLSRDFGNQNCGLRVLPRGRWLELAAASALVGAWSVQTYFGPALASIYWNRYLRASVADSQLSQQMMAKFVAGENVSRQADRRVLSEAMLRHLESAIYWDPRFALAHNRLADRYVAEFEHRASVADNAMDVTQIRDAALASSFASSEELYTWLGRAFGPDIELLRRSLKHVHRAIDLCPLQGDAYLHLAELSFLERGDRAAAEAYIDQGIRVRPYDRNVLTKAGVQALLMGRIDVAIDLWSRCFNTPGRHQQEIVYRLVACGLPANEFIKSFHPDWRTLPKVWAQYRKFGQPQDLNDILAHAASETQRAISTAGGIPPANVWLWQSCLYADVGRFEEALACLERAYACDPRQLAIRHRLARALQAAGRFAEAEPHYRWCLARRPADKSISTALVAIAKARLAQREAVHPLDDRWNPNASPPKTAGASTTPVK